MPLDGPPYGAPEALNATNEIVVATPGPGGGGSPEPPSEGTNAKPFEYDAAGNLAAQRLPDRLNASGEPLKELRKVFRHDPWGRLTRVFEQARDPGASASAWALEKTLAAYTYYAGNQRATRTARHARSPRDVDGSSGDDDPDELGLFYYDDQWRLLDERTEAPYTGPWSSALINGQPDGGAPGPGAPGFGDVPSDHEVRLTQYIWDPTGQDQLVQVRTTPLPGVGGGSAPVPPPGGGSVEGFASASWTLTDRRNDVLALVDADHAALVLNPGAPGLPAVFNPSFIQRIRYSSWGVPEFQPWGDLDGDGDRAPFDLSLVASLKYLGEGGSATVYGNPAYAADADLDFNGAIDDADLALIGASSFDTRSNLAALWDLGIGGGSPPPGSPALSIYAGLPSVGYAGSAYDRASGLWLMRNRWYDPALAHWISRDPAGYVDGMSLYLYVSGNPLTYWDPFGLAPDSVMDKRVQAFREIGRSDAGGSVTVDDVVMQLPATVATEAAQQLIVQPFQQITSGNPSQMVQGAMNAPGPGRIVKGAMTVAKGVMKGGAAAVKAMKAMRAKNAAKNAAAGTRRERATHADLQSQHPDASVQDHQPLRNPDGTMAVDPKTGEGRVVDHVVIEDGNVKRVVETTSETANKKAQAAKEGRIRESSNVHIKDRDTGEMLPAKDVDTETCRRP